MEILYHMIELGVNTFQLCLILKYLLYMSLNPKKLIPLSLAAEAGLFLLSVMTTTPQIIVQSYVVFLPIPLMLLSFDYRKPALAAYSIIGSIIFTSCETLTLHCLYTIGDMIHHPLSEISCGMLVMLLTTIFWISIISYIYKKRLGYFPKRHTKFFVFLALAFRFNSVIFQTFRRCINANFSKVYGGARFVNCFILFFGVALLAELAYIIFLYYEKTHYSIINDFTQEYLNIEKEHFHEVQKLNEDTRRFRHDIMGHLVVINDFAKEGNLVKVTQYLETVNKEFTAIQQKYRTGHEVIDSVLNQKAPVLESDAIALEIDGNLSVLRFMDDFDVCTIFSNTTQNAIEACERLRAGKERWIRIRLRTNGSVYVLEIANPVEENIKIRQELPATSKPDRQNHGFGLKQVEQIVRNLAGSMSLRCQDYIFALTIQLHRTREPECV